MAIYTKSVLKALNSGEIVPYFQPQFDSNNGFMTGAEILARWIKPDGTMVMPDTFIPVLEKTGTITELDWYMAEQACIALQQINNNSFSIAVNFSRWHMEEPDFLPRINGLVEKYQIDKSRLHIEITETAVYLTGQPMVNWVTNIHNDGYLIALDDFCSGLSSVGTVAELPIDIIKFDKSIFKDVSNSKTRIILDALFYGAHRLGLDTIAEGIENDEQLKFVQMCDCNKVQGFLFDKPMPKDDFIFLANGYSEKGLEKLSLNDVQTYTSVMHLMIQAIYKHYPLIILGNLSKNCYYMISHEDFTSTLCPAVGSFDELIEDGAATMHPEDKEKFMEQFSRTSLLNAFAEGKKGASMIARQKGDDGVYRKVEISDYFVSNPAKNDVFVISLNRNI